MKNNQNKIINQTQDSKQSIVASINSLGSLGPFLGVKDSSACGTYISDNLESQGGKKQSIDRQIFKTNDSLVGNKALNYTQIQNKPINQINPVFLQTGETGI